MQIDPTSRFSRQIGYADPDCDAIRSIVLAGCGSVGRQIGLALGAMGFGHKLTLWDPDFVETANLSTQGWSAERIGDFKAIVLADEITTNFPDRPPHCQPIRYDGSPSADVVILALDSIHARRIIVDRLADDARSGRIIPPRLIVDPRQNPTGCRLVCVTPDAGDWHARYQRTLPDREDNAGCVRPQTYYQSLITAGLAVQQIMKLSIGQTADCDILYDGADCSITNLNPSPIPAMPDRRT